MKRQTIKQTSAWPSRALTDPLSLALAQAVDRHADETKILLRVAASLGKHDEEFCTNLANWGDIIRRTFREGGVDEVISTRRLVHIMRAYAIWGDRMKAIKVCVNRFDDETKQAFLELYDKVDADFIITHEGEEVAFKVKM